MSHRDTVRAYYDAINHGRYEAYDEHCTEGFEDVATHGHTTGRAQAKQAALATHGSFADLRFTLDELVEEGDRVAVRGHLSGRQVAPFFGAPNLGRSFEIGFIGIYHFEGDRIARRYVNGDDMGMARQLGWVPAQP